jgi:Na+-translocating ferredoxin:NAD+ oxidoreductase subunit C
VAATGGSAPGLDLESHKHAAMARRIAPAPVPAQALVALDQGNGRGGTPCVRIGERVRLGSLLARADTETGTDLHAPVAGRVSAIESLPLAPETGHAIVIDNDGTDERDPANEACPDYAALAPEALLERIRRAGIAGLGGAAYPTATKLERSRAGAVTHLVLNGAECEPWICCDDALMRERADDVVLGAQAMLHACGAARCTIAIEDDTPEAGAALHTALTAAGDARLSLAVLPALYPAGAERQLLTSITGIEVPQHGWPPDVGLLCQNVGTAAAVARLVQTGEPLIRRIVTVTGTGVAAAGNFEARIGTPLAILIEAAGGYAGAPQRLWYGGSLTGRALPDDALPLTKAMNCIVAATGADLRAPGPELPCIRCGDCARICPAALLPQELHRAVRSGNEAALARFGLADCIECGCCDYVCPSAIPLTERFRIARIELARRAASTASAAQARLHFEHRERRLAALEETRRRALEQARRQARGPSAGGD